MLKIVMLNLISNSIKYSHFSGAISIFTIKNEEGLIVSDNGLCINNERLNKLFDLTQKFSSTGTDKKKVSVLGLIICKELVEKHGGKIWLKVNLGKYKHFFFNLTDKKTERK
jgi:two-component system sensor histidine kinase/response regulator